MAETEQEKDKRRHEPDAAVGPPSARVRDDDLEPHEGLRYIAKLFKALALLLIFMLIAEMIIGLQQDGAAALGTLLIEATRLIVFAGFLWGAGDLAVMLVESNHDVRAARILLGRVNGRLERLVELEESAGDTRGSGDNRATMSGDPRRSMTGETRLPDTREP